MRRNIITNTAVEDRTLFLTSKVRLHCDLWDPSGIRTGLEPFPDLKGQAPLRRNIITNTAVEDRTLFLTSKVRLHCDQNDSVNWAQQRATFS